MGHDTLLRLNNSLYGQAEAPRLWFEKLEKVLEDIDFNPSGADTCIFISDKVMCLAYVDDCLLFDTKQEDIN